MTRPEDRDGAPSRYIESARRELEAFTREQKAQWRLGTEATWDADLNAGTLTLRFADGRELVRPMRPVGTWNSRDGSFLWAWDHPSIPSPRRDAAMRARRWGLDHSLRGFSSPLVPCFEDDAWTFSAVTARLHGWTGIYRGRCDASWLYMIFEPPGESAGPTSGATPVDPGHAIDTGPAPMPLQAPAAATPAARGPVPPRPTAPARTGRLPGWLPTALHTLAGRASDLLAWPRERYRLQWPTRLRQPRRLRAPVLAEIISHWQVRLARRRGQLAPLPLVPVSPGGDDLDHVALPGAALPHAPPYFCALKTRLDHLLQAKLVRAFARAGNYRAEPVYRGRSRVPSALRFEVSGTVPARGLMAIWSPGVPGSEVSVDDIDPSPADPEPRRLIRAFVADYFDWHQQAAAEVAAHRANRDGRAPAPVPRELFKRIGDDYVRMVRRHGLPDFKSRGYSVGSTSSFDPAGTRIIAELHLGDEINMVARTPMHAGDDNFHTFDFELIRHEGRWRIRDVVLASGFERLPVV